MKDPISEAVLAWADARWTRRLAGGVPGGALPFRVVWMWGVLGMLLLGLPICGLARGISGGWSLWAFWVPGSAGLFAGALAGGMMWLASRRRAAAGETVGVGAPSRSVRLRWAVQMVLFVLVLAAGVAFASALEVVRGNRAFRAYTTELATRGEPLRVDEVVPAPVPEAENLARAPLFAALLEYQRSPDTHEVQWADPQAIARVERIQLTHPREGLYRGSFRGFASKVGRPERTWLSGAPMDLVVWAAYLAGRTNLAEGASPEEAARGVLSALKTFDAELEELAAAAAQRPRMRFPVRYEEGFDALLPHLARLKSITAVLQLRAVARLRTGDTEGAMSDILLGYRLRDGLVDDPLLITLLVRISLETLLYQPIWEGCREHLWTEAQLHRLQDAIGTDSCIPRLVRSLRAERILADRLFEALIHAREGGPKVEWFMGGEDDRSFFSSMRLMNRGWLQQNRVIYGRFVQTDIDRLKGVTRHVEVPSIDSRVLALANKHSLYSVIAAAIVPAIDKAVDRVFEAETRRRLAVAGLALERYRLAEGRYPAALDALSPKYAAAGILEDPMDGASLRYRVLEQGGHLLYSIGSDHKDDGGVHGHKERGQSAGGAPVAGDWLW